MPDLRLTLRVTRDTNLVAAVARLEAELQRGGIQQPQLIALVGETAQRFQNELRETSNNQPTVANTRLSGPNYRIRITTSGPSKLDLLGDRLIPWQSSFS